MSKHEQCSVAILSQCKGEETRKTPLLMGTKSGKMAFPSTKVQNSPISLFPISDQSIKHCIVSYAKELGSYTLVFCNSCDCIVQGFSTRTAAR